MEPASDKPATDPREASISARTPRWKRAIVCALGICIFAASALLAFAYLLPQNLRNVSQPYLLFACISFVGRVLTFHIGAALVVACVFAATLRRRWLAAIAGVCGIIALLPTFASYLPRHAPPAVGNSLRIMSFNAYVENRELEKLGAQVRAVNPDLLLIQEFTPDVQAAMDRALAGDYPYRTLWPSVDPDGSAIYSRLPFLGPVNRNAGLYGGHNVFRVEVLVNDRRVTLFAAHFRSPQSMRAIADNRLQIADFVDKLARETQPTIVAGDFNFTETTPNFTALRRAGLVSTHDLAGTGRACTWPFRPAYRGWLPGVRIDHILLSKDFTCTRSYVGADIGSDHRPIVTEVAFGATSN